MLTSRARFKRISQIKDSVEGTGRVLDHASGLETMEAA
jgi:hypothetical protein